MSGNSSQCRRRGVTCRANLPLSPALLGLCSHVWLPPPPRTPKIFCCLSLENVSKNDGFAHSGDFVFLGLSPRVHVIQLLFVFLLLIHLSSV